MRELAPDPRLQAVVRGYWQADWSPPPTPEQHQQMPQHLWHLAFCSADSWEGSAGGLWTPAPAATLQPIRAQSEMIWTRGFSRRLVAQLYPWAVQQLFGRALADPSKLAEAPEAQAIRALLTLGDWSAAQETLEDWLLRLQHAHATEAGKGVQAAQRLYATPGQAKIGVLADELNLCPRQLEREFKREVGTTPKTLARLIRFDALTDRMMATPDLVLTTLAYDLGFSDQAHLSKEFQQLTQMSPSAFQVQVELRRAGEVVG